MSLIVPNWPAPANVRACSSTRQGGVSQAPWDSLNLGAHVGDELQHVQTNRQRLLELADLPSMPQWLEQVHGTEVLTLDWKVPDSLRADAAYTRTPGVVCAVMTADCLPVLFCSQDGQEVAAAHAGWRGLCNGVLEATINAFSAPPSQIYAWLGPAIGPDAFEVGPEVREAFIAQNPAASAAFRPEGEKFYADLGHLAKLRLEAAGVRHVWGGGQCTLKQSEQFFSFRRDGVTGRMASLIWVI
ncbi:purine nucleoside phosphorylase YfiH [Erwinia sorbitola]|uniref:Purine nucleoside phosphorylase n=1 Tax=Erwinia sorbitola TaxID=2681984 RepID=A0A6I6ED23_9GAMM|nr:purine nucleoside phosphorylase YfiH [Erwinia sorbitola]MTD28443.1 polyphenol oxidase [Erwinia sorbitola]QGU86558.1 polyphenol oxidase [Erwinia sorbitola]